MKFNNFIKALVIIGIAVINIGCSDSGNERIEGSINRLEKEIVVTVTTVKNEQELKELYDLYLLIDIRTSKFFNVVE